MLDMNQAEELRQYMLRFDFSQDAGESLITGYLFPWDDMASERQCNLCHELVVTGMTSSKKSQYNNSYSTCACGNINWPSVSYIFTEESTNKA